MGLGGRALPGVPLREQLCLNHRKHYLSVPMSQPQATAVGEPVSPRSLPSVLPVGADVTAV